MHGNQPKQPEAGHSQLEHLEIGHAEVEWLEDTPVATAFDDPYFSKQQGLAESRYVFLEQNRLAERFRQCSQDCSQEWLIAETGFGTGLNALLAAQLFLKAAPPSAQLCWLSCEKFPLRQKDLQRAHHHWPELAPLCQALQSQWPSAKAGHYRLQLHPRVQVVLSLMDAQTALDHWQQQGHEVDAWCLDGFAPARNPDMWQQDLFDAMARLCKPGTSLATFTAAGFVRRGLQQAGFAMRKAPGFGSKREMLVGEFAVTNTSAS